MSWWPRLPFVAVAGRWLPTGTATTAAKALHLPRLHWRIAALAERLLFTSAETFSLITSIGYYCSHFTAITTIAASSTATGLLRDECEGLDIAHSDDDYLVKWLALQLRPVN